MDPNGGRASHANQVAQRNRRPLPALGGLARFSFQLCCVTVTANVALQLVDRELLLGDQVPDEIADRHHADQLCWCAISLMASKTLADASIV
jgi:hypothetical protein